MTTSRNIKWPVIIFVAVILTACGELLQNPLKDRETGENINLLIVDFNFFRTHITVNLFDAASGNRIDTPVTLKLAGENGADIVTYSGIRREAHEILHGKLELTVDPNRKIAASDPFTFSLTATADGYNPATRTGTFMSEGKKSIDLFLSKKSDGTDSQVGGGVDTGNGDTTIFFGFGQVLRLKSALEANPFRIKYSMTLQDFLKLKDTNGNLLFASSAEFWDAYQSDPDGFLYLHTNTFGNYPSWPDILKKDGASLRVILQILETGTVEYMSVGGKRVGSFNGAVMKSIAEWTGDDEPATWGFARFEPEGWLYEGTELLITDLPFSYTVIRASAETLCGTGAKIRFEAGFKSSFSITADIYDMQGRKLLDKYFSGNFPAEFSLENVPGVPARLVFRDDNPSFMPLPALDVADLCSGNYTVTVQPQTGFTGYQIVLKAFCPDNPAVAVAPSYSGEYRFAGTSNSWQGGFMQGGILDLLGKPDQEYEYRLLWENEWEVTHFTTTFNPDGSYPFASDSKISSEKLADGRTRINVSHTFRQNVCDKMNW